MAICLPAHEPEFDPDPGRSHMLQDKEAPAPTPTRAGRPRARGAYSLQRGKPRAQRKMKTKRHHTE